MALAFEMLDERTRDYMIDEIERDVLSKNLYIGKNLNERGVEIWPDLLRDAARHGDDGSLAVAILENGCLKDRVERKTPSGGSTTAKVSSIAHEMLAEGEFNRFYVRALCRRAIDDEVPNLEVFRAKEVRNPRRNSEEMIGRRVKPSEVLKDLRNSPGVEPALGLPPGPNSGLSLRFPS